MQLEKHKPGATIVPVILLTDKTQLILFRNKVVYPVYVSIGNIPKEIRRKPSHHAQTLLAYLPATWLEHIENKSSHRRSLANIFHACMAKVLKPLESAGVSGVEMTRGDGVIHQCHPLLATFVGDYPEQCLVTCTKHCPICPTPKDELGEDKSLPIRAHSPVFEALSRVDDLPSVYSNACKEAGIKPVVHPFWECLPYLHIFWSITPDCQNPF